MYSLKNLRAKLYVSAAVFATAAGAYFNPVPIAQNWGHIAARDMDNKAVIAEKVKEAVAANSQERTWNAYQILTLLAAASPRSFTESRIPDAKELGFINAFDLPLPKSKLEDVLHLSYNELFSDGTQRLERGELASYHDVRKQMLHELYTLFKYKDYVSRGLITIRDHISRDRFLKGDLGLIYRYDGEREEDFIARIFENDVVDLNEKPMNAALLKELDKVGAAFKSPENQSRIYAIAQGAGKATNMQWNGMLFLILSLGAIGVIDYLREKNETALV